MATNDLNPFKEDHVNDQGSSLDSRLSSRISVSSDSSVTDSKQPTVVSFAKDQVASSSLSSSNAYQRSLVGIDPQKVKTFLMLLAKACKRHEIRMQAHQQFHDHISKIKTTASTKAYDSNNLNSDLDELKKKVSYLINVEKNPETGSGKFYQEKIALLEGKLNKLMQSKLEREERFDELEKRINVKLDTDKQMMDALEKKLLILQKKLLEKRMSSRSPKNKQGIDLLRKQIQKTHDSLEDIKSRQKAVSQV